MDVDDHALAVDVGELQLRRFGSPETGGVQQQQNRSIADVGRGLNQLLDFLGLSTTGSFFGRLVRAMS